jgi:signal transduction histidine kinase
LRIYLWGVSLAWGGVVAWELSADVGAVTSQAPILLAWSLLQAVASLLPIQGRMGARLTSNDPIVAASAIVLNPIGAGISSFVGSVDPKELRRDIALGKTIFNRSQVALGAWAGSVVVHALPDSLESSALLVPAAFVALGTSAALNYAFVTIAISLEQGRSIRTILPRLHLGSPLDYSMTLAGWGALAAMLAGFYNLVGLWALMAFLMPLLLSRQVLMRSQMWLEAARAYKRRERALAEITRRIAEERLDERRLIAADLHDEVLQPLFKVSLMAHVLKADLAGGRLLELDEDLPELVSATEMASGSLRGVIGDLRRSTLGREGLSVALKNLVRIASRQSSAKLEAAIGEIEADPVQQLAVYQIAKEALHNAIVHSRATKIRLELAQEGGDIRLLVEDDGIGFDTEFEQEEHFGIHLMRERASIAAGHLFLDSVPGQGCRVQLIVPRSRRSDHKPARS